MPDRIPRDDLTDLERQLAALRPSPGGLDRDRMLFEAGRASARAERRSWAWAAVAAASALVSVGLGLELAHERSRADESERALGMVRVGPPSPIVAPPRPEPSPPIEVAPDSYLALSRRLVAGLDDPSPVPSAPPGRMAPDRPPSPLRVRGSEGFRDL